LSIVPILRVFSIKFWTLKKVIKKILGTIEEVNFPEVQLFGIKSKVDTGASTSSIDAKQIKIIQRDEANILQCRLISSHHPFVEFPDFTTREVKSSNGSVELRYVIKLQIRLYGKNFKSEFTLANRNSMTYPVLLGKRLLNGRFLVDVSQRNLSSKHEKEL
jgi:hypothetical protein